MFRKNFQNQFLSKKVKVTISKFNLELEEKVEKSLAHHFSKYPE